MSTTTWGWLVLAFPLAGTILIGLGHKRLGRGPAGAIGTVAILLAFISAVNALISLQDHESTASSSPRCGTTRSQARSTRDCRSSSTRCRSS